MKQRMLELQAGLPTQKGSKPGLAAAYSLRHVREWERALAEQAERAPARFVANWRNLPKEKADRTASASSRG